MAFATKSVSFEQLPPEYEVPPDIKVVTNRYVYGSADLPERTVTYEKQAPKLVQPPAKEIFCVHLELCEEEAETLRAVLFSVGGNPLASRRGYAERIYEALTNLTGANLPNTGDMGGGVTFEDTTEPSPKFFAPAPVPNAATSVKPAPATNAATDVKPAPEHNPERRWYLPGCDCSACRAFRGQA